MPIALYPLLKFAHLLGMTLFVGDIIIVALFKVLADRSKDVRVQYYAQRLLILTDKVFMLPGAALLASSGFAMAYLFDVPLLANARMVAAVVLFVAAAAIWAIGLVPLQNAQLVMLTEVRERGTRLDAGYDLLSRRWMVLGTCATVLPIAAMLLMLLR